VTLNTSNDERYGDGVGTNNSRPGSSISQANGYTALNNAGAYQFLRVTAAAGNNITFTPALTSAYTQNAGSTTRRTYQVIRVPQYPSVTIDGANPVTPLPWNGLVGGVVAMDVAGRLTFTGAGPHIEASNRGFRGGVQGVNDSAFPSGTLLYRGTATADGGSKGEGIGGTPQYVQTSVAGGYNSGTRFSDGAPTSVDNGAAGGYPNGDFLRGAPANAGGGGNSHNAAGGGGGNGGRRRQRRADLQRRRPAGHRRLRRLARTANRRAAGHQHLHGRRRRLGQPERRHQPPRRGWQRRRHHHGARRQLQRPGHPARRRPARLGLQCVQRRRAAAAVRAARCC
jgi:hypothetical protein